MAAILGGEELEVVHLPLDYFDAADLKRLEKFRPLLGQTESVKVRHIKVSQFGLYRYAILRGDEATAIELYCGKDSGWGDTLHPDSVNAIADRGLEINYPFFSASFRRQMKWNEAQTPEAILELQTRLKELETMAFSGSASQTSSPETPSTTG